MTSIVADTDGTSVHVSIEVPAAPDRAFEIFTTGIDTWWVRSHHITPGELKQVAVEPWVGGRMWEQNTEGDSCQWGRVTRWEPPAVFAFEWLLGPEFDRPAPDAPGSDVTVTFAATPVGTRVDLVHTNLAVHGPAWTALRDGVAGANGWPVLLAAFAGQFG